MTNTSHSGMIIRTNADLVAFWTTLMGPGQFGQRSLWLVFLDEQNRTLPIVVPIDDVPAEPDALMISNLAKIVAELASNGDAASVVLLLSRPGADVVTAADRRWATVLGAELGSVTDRPVHLATHGRVQILVPDGLAAAS
jgi:hypothetical protein